MLLQRADGLAKRGAADAEAFDELALGGELGPDREGSELDRLGQSLDANLVRAVPVGPPEEDVVENRDDVRRQIVVDRRLRALSHRQGGSRSRRPDR